jgi:alkylhydroperoxidase family enzyme
MARNVPAAPAERHRRRTTDECEVRRGGTRDAWDIIEVAAMFNFTNRLMSGAGVMPNPEYLGMAR